MKICIPTENANDPNAAIYGHFGSAPFFIVFDTEDKNVFVIENNNSHHEHGQCNPVGLLQINGINAIICKGIGPRAIQLMNSQGIKVYFSGDKENVIEIASDFSKGLLQEFSLDYACQSHGCH